MKEKEISVMMRACVILHNMIVEDEQDNHELAFNYDVADGTTPESIFNHDHLPYYDTSKDQKTLAIEHTCSSSSELDLGGSEIGSSGIHQS